MLNIYIYEYNIHIKLKHTYLYIKKILINYIYINSDVYQITPVKNSMITYNE